MELRLRQICTKIASLLKKFGTKKIAGGNAIQNVTRLYNTLCVFFDAKDNNNLDTFLESETLGRDLRKVTVYYNRSHGSYPKYRDIDDSLPIEENFSKNRIENLDDVKGKDCKYITFIIANNPTAWELVKRVFQQYSVMFMTRSEDIKRLSNIIQYYEQFKQPD
jgi:hypothetical protein